MISILYLITGTDLGGTERSLFEICRRLDRRRYAPTVVSLKSPGPVSLQIQNLGIEVLSLNMREAADWFSMVEFVLGLWRIPRLLRGRSFDILHSFLFRANLFGRYAAGRCEIGKTLSSYRGTLEEPKKWMLALDRRSLDRADLFTTQSEGLAGDLHARLGIPPEKIAVIPNGIDLAAADRSLATARTGSRDRLGLSPADMVLVFVGRLHREKGLDSLLTAFKDFTHTHPRARLLLAGDGPERDRLEQMAETLRLSPHVTFLGSVSSPWEVLASADIFVLPSLYEGMPNAVLEAMAAGLPVVATTVGALPEMIEEGKEGTLVPPEDSRALFTALETLAWSSDRREAMGRRGRETVQKKFRADHTAEKLDRLYQKLMT